MHNRGCLFLVALATSVCAPDVAFAESATLFRVFLNDGTAVVSYGEYARVGDRLIFSMPIGAVDERAGAPVLHVVNVPVSSVNLTATERYADSARFSHYMATRAEADYAALAREVASTLNGIVLIKDPKERLRLAVDARKRLASWPKEHYGYRAADVREMLGMLDEAISNLRAAAGETEFSINLVADTSAPDQRNLVPLIRPPTAAETISHAISVAQAVDAAAERMSILKTIVNVLDRRDNQLPSDWAKQTRRWAVHAIGQELRIEKRYISASARLLKRATESAAKADVRGVQRVLNDVSKVDEQLGGKRPQTVKSLVEQVKLHLDAARRLQLAREQWHERADSFRAYMQGVEPIIEGLSRAQRSLDDIKGLVGSDAAELVSLGVRFASDLKALNVMPVPDALKPAHAVLVSAMNLAETAVRTRRQAAASGELRLAWDASSAAAGSMMLFDKAQEDLKAAVRYPEIR